MSDEGPVTWLLVGMILVSVCCTSLAQISLKHGMTVEYVQMALEGAMPVVLAIIASPMVWPGLVLYAIVWLFALAKL
jgi:hypothetical protein